MNEFERSFRKHKKLMLEHLLKEGVEFITYVQIDPTKMGKTLPIQDDVEVLVVADGSYEDRSFSYEMGSIAGTHDPGSGFVAEELKIVANEDIFAYDQDGNQTNQILFRQGEKIDEKFILQKSMEKLVDDASKKLEDGAQNRDDWRSDDVVKEMTPKRQSLPTEYQELINHMENKFNRTFPSGLLSNTQQSIIDSVINYLLKNGWRKQR